MRLRDIGEARIALEEMIATPVAEGEAPLAPASTRSRVAAPALGIAGLLVGALAMLLIGRALRPVAPDVPLRKLRLALPAGSASAPTWPAVSPDGRNVAYVFNGAVWVQSLREPDPRELKTDPDPSHLFWSADSRFLGYVSGTRIMKLSLEGGENQAI